MDYFEGVSAKERYDNDVLNELRTIRKLLERNAQAPEQKIEKQVKAPVQRRKRKGVVKP